MTDLERVELAVRRVSSRLHDVTASAVLRELAEELCRMRNAPHPVDPIPGGVMELYKRR